MRKKGKSDKVKYRDKAEKRLSTKSERLKSKKRRITKSIRKRVNYLKELNGIQIYKYIEMIPIHDDEEQKMIKQRISKIKKELKIKDHSKFVIRDIESWIDKSLLSNESWLLTQLDIAERIIKFLETRDPNIAVETIKDYAEVIFYDSEDIGLSLLLRLGSEGYEKLVFRHLKARIPYAIPYENPFKRQILHWSFLTKWGNEKERRDSNKWLKKTKIPTFIIEVLGPGRPKGTFRVPITYQQLDKTYKTILTDIQKRFKNISRKLQLERRRVLIDYIEDKNLVEPLTTIFPFNNVGFGYEGKKNKIAEYLADLNPHSPSNIAFTITGHIYNMKPSTVRSRLNRTKRRM